MRSCVAPSKVRARPKPVDSVPQERTEGAQRCAPLALAMLGWQAARVSVAPAFPLVPVDQRSDEVELYTPRSPAVVKHSFLPVPAVCEDQFAVVPVYCTRL